MAMNCWPNSKIQMEKFIKTPNQIAAMMQHWFLHYHDKNKAFFSGSEDFTFFDLVVEGLLFYKDFVHHTGYKSMAILSMETNAAVKSIKTDGYFQEFGLKIRSGEVIYWSIPSGKPGFAFWNVTKKCELIGRRYL